MSGCMVSTRQSLDGIVQRDDKGLEKRFPVILTAEEKLMARQVSLAFKVCDCTIHTVLIGSIKNCWECI